LQVILLLTVLAAQTETATIADDTYVLPAEGARTITWYGWETLSFDLTFGLAVIASAIVLAHQHQHEGWLAPIGLPYIVATPIAHGFHDNLVLALISGGIRLVLPAAAYAVIRATCDGRFCVESSVGHQAALWTGFVVGLAIGPLVDAILFAWEEE
jgi:hypothetical protein